MCNMNEKKLNKDQKARIEELKRQWLAELEKIPPTEQMGWPNIKANRPYQELERKYMAKIKAIHEE